MKHARAVPTVLLTLLALGACEASVTEPEPEPDCAPPGPEAEWCHHLDNDAVKDTLIPLPPDTIP